MPIEILMPALSPTMKEGNLAKWLKKEGDEVTAGDVIAEIETDKATMEVEAVDEGKLGKILVTEGSKNVPVNQVIAVLLEDGEDAKTLKDYKPSEPANDDAGKDKKEDKAATPAPAPAAAQPAPAKALAQPIVPVVNSVTSQNSSVTASPVAKKIADQNGINLASVKGTGPKGRVTKEDVMHFLSQPNSGSVVNRVADEAISIPNNNIRQVIAERLVASKQTIPHFYLSLDCNISDLVKSRAQINDAAPKDESGRPAYKVSVNDLVIKAVALALKKVPAANASWTDEAVLQYNNVDISVAVAIDDGLITPIVRNADQKSVLNISSEMKSLATKARQGTLAPEEFQGGGFSISNLGMYGIKQFNAIVNPPQSAILAVGAGEKKVVVADNGEFKAIDVMTVSLSCDHRVVDGAVGAQFLQSFKYYIENPATLLL